MKKGIIKKVSGPLVVGKSMADVQMYEVVRVSDKKLIGEVIKIEKDLAYIQVYEDTSGIGPGEPIYCEERPFTVTLGPGLVGTIYDGIQRPLSSIREKTGDFITKGVEVPPLNLNKKWKFSPKIKQGESVGQGDVIGEVQETAAILHKIMVPYSVKGTIKEIKKGEFTVEEVVAKIETENGIKEVKLAQEWPIREPRPVKKRLVSEDPLITGQRVIDTFFPIAKGGTACAPGPFGSGKTVIQHQIAKWSDADIIIFIGCGERGNEMADALAEFSHLEDPKTGRLLIEKTILIANTSNMPVAAREACIYTGVTIGEYFRDMGLNVALIADSTSRWAEALREISGRLEEMPGEEGYPAYLGSRTSVFYERAGKVVCKGSEDKIGSLTIIGAVSPSGGDFSEPVTQNTLRVTKIFWGLDEVLASQRHYPSINWLTSYSLYTKDLEEYFNKEVSSEFIKARNQAMRLLQKEASLQEVVRLVGTESLSPEDRLSLIVAKMIREDFLQQNAFDDVDTFTSLEKQDLILRAIVEFYKMGKRKIKEKISLEAVTSMEYLEKISKLKFIPEKEKLEIKKLIDSISYA